MVDAVPDDLDVTVVGAGFAGIYAVHHFRSLGLSVLAFEKGDGVGGTWYWNRYPGARCDVPSFDYSYQFSDSLARHWEWSEYMAAQPEIERYLNWVTDRLDLRSLIHLGCEVTRAEFDERLARWQISTADGRCLSSRFCVLATGPLSVPVNPDLPCLEDFQGETLFTSRWPRIDVDLANRRIGLVGTGSSGIQAMPVLADKATHLYVFQRTATYAFPARNRPLDAEDQAAYQAHLDQIIRLQRASFLGVSGIAAPSLPPRDRSILEASPDERRAALDRWGWDGVRAWTDVMVDLDANEAGAELYREMVRRTVRDQRVAERLCPKGMPMGCRRIVLHTDYFETFNQDNVTLVDLREGGIERIVADGVESAQGRFELDALVLATGFDAVSGAVLQIDIRGRDGRSLREAWDAGPATYLGLQTAGFPNLFMTTGPQSPGVLANMVAGSEHHVELIGRLIGTVLDRGARTVEAERGAQYEWGKHVYEASMGTMYTAATCNSWYLGSNVAGKPRAFNAYAGGFDSYVARCEEAFDGDFDGFAFT